MKLCIASPAFHPSDGGAQQRFRRYLPGLRERGIDVVVLTGTPVADHGDRGLDADRESSPFLLDGTPAYRVRLPPRWSWARAFSFHRALVDFCARPETRPDVVQLVANLRPPALLFLPRLRRLGIPSAYAVTIAPKHTSGRPATRFSAVGQRVLFDAFDRLVANSSAVRETLREMGVATPVEVIPNGVDLSRFRPARDPEERKPRRDELGVGQDELLVTSVGSVMPRKGSDLLLGAWVEVSQRFPDAHLVLVGSRKDLEQAKLGSFGQRLQERIAACRTPEHVHLIGPRADVASWLRASDVFALASRREGMPNAVLEAMACGLPVVSTPFVGLAPELGTPGTHFLRAELAEGAIADCLIRLLSSEPLRRELGAEARRWAEVHFDSERCLDRYADFYRELRAAGPRR